MDGEALGLFGSLLLILGALALLLWLDCRENETKRLKCESAGGRLIEEGRVCIRKDVILVEE